MANTEVAFDASFSLNPISSLPPKGMDLMEVAGWLCSIQCAVFAPWPLWCQQDTKGFEEGEILVPRRRSAPKNTVKGEVFPEFPN